MLAFAFAFARRVFVRDGKEGEVIIAGGRKLTGS